MGIIGRHDSAQEKRATLAQRLIPALILLLVLAVAVAVFYFYRRYPGAAAQLKGYGYLGAFLVSLTLNATVVLPAGNFLLLSAFGATLPSPLLVGLAAGAGAAIGEPATWLAIADTRLCDNKPHTPGLRAG